MLFPFNFRLIEERGKLNQRNCGRTHWRAKLWPNTLWWRALPMINTNKSQSGSNLQLITRIMMRLSNRPSLGDIVQVWTEVNKADWRLNCAFLGLVLNSWCKGDLGRIWPQISYSIRQELFWCGILKSSQPFRFYLLSDKWITKIPRIPNFISYRIIRVRMDFNVKFDCGRQRQEGVQAGLNLYSLWYLHCPF